MAAGRALAEPFRRLVVDGRIPRSPPASAAKMARPTIKPVWPGWPGLHYPASTFALWMKKYKCEMSATKQHSKDLSDPKILVSYNKWNRNKVCFSLSLSSKDKVVTNLRPICLTGFTYTTHYDSGHGGKEEPRLQSQNLQKANYLISLTGCTCRRASSLAWTPDERAFRKYFKYVNLTYSGAKGDVRFDSSATTSFIIIKLYVQADKQKRAL